MELVLFRAFEEAGLLAPNMWMEMPMGSDPFFAGWVNELLCSVRPQMQQHNLSCETLGDFDTLRQKLLPVADQPSTITIFATAAH